MNDAFTVRELCPGCHHDSCSQLYSASLAHAPISEYLEAFYASQGGIDLSALEGGHYVLMECGRCGLIFQRDVLSDRLMYRLYEEWIDPVRSLDIYEAERSMNHVLTQLRQIADLIHFMGPGQIRALDYGMGWGHWCRLATAMGLDVYGHELSLAKANHAARYGIRNLPREELHSYSFDFVNVDQVLEHVAHPLDTLAELVQILRPGGLIRISVPDGWNIKRRLQSPNWLADKQAYDSLNPVAPLEHVNCFSHAALLNIAGKAGLVPTRVPSRYPPSCGGRVKNVLRSIYYSLRGTPGTTLYFRRSQ